MEGQAFGDLTAQERRLANAQARSKSAEMRVVTDQLLAQTAGRIERGKRRLARHKGRPLP